MKKQLVLAEILEAISDAKSLELLILVAKSAKLKTSWLEYNYHEGNIIQECLGF